MGIACPGVQSAVGYVDDVNTGEIPACRWIRLATKRFVNDLKRSEEDPEFPYRFDQVKAEKAIRFIEQLPHTKGKWALKRQRLILSPWQRFFVASVFGWVHKETGLRRFRRASLYVPRKNGKSLLVAGIGLYMLLMDNEHGAEVYCGATKEKQAWEVFKPARLMVEKTPALRAFSGVQVQAKKLEVPRSGALFEPVIGKPGDGASPHCAINDEYHEQQTDDLVDTMLTGMGARDQPLMLDSTTAGASIAGPCYAHQKDLERVLSGAVVDEELFGLIYTVDTDDDWTDLATLRKANPNFGISVGADFLKSELAKAIRTPRNQNRFKTKHLNIWVSSREAYYNMEEWAKCADASLKVEDFANDPCYVGFDLSEKCDLTAVVYVFKRAIANEDHYYVVAPRFYIPEAAVGLAENKHYQGWVEEGCLTETDGNITDFKRIRNDIGDSAETLSVQEVAYDPWNAASTAQELQDDYGLTMAEVRMRVQHLSEPMKWIAALAGAGRIHHDGNPILAWCMSNVVAKVDANDNVFPRKENNRSKIDGAVALITGMNRAMAGEAPTKRVTQGFVEI